MKRNITTLLQTACLSAGLFYCRSLSVSAVTEAEVQAQVSTAGREAVTGSVFIWFLCAIAFLKVSRKLDSFLAGIGLPVGNTGGSLLAEAMVAFRGMGSLLSFSGIRSTQGTGELRPGSRRQNTFSGGLAGIVSRRTTQSAASYATASGSGSGTDAAGSSPSTLGGRLYAASVSRGGSFANSVTGSIAAGNRREQGSITGDRAAEAFLSYFGFPAPVEGTGNIPAFSNVEIGGGRITGTEISEAHPDGITFGMYHAEAFDAPTGTYETVYAADGSAWYRQYAADTVERTPSMAPDGTAAYQDTIVRRLPPPPYRKDRI